jgi:ATP-dependent helicase/nuclease subunit A
LQQPGISDWVFYKLNGGFDHILVDEAQDTSPAQWQVLKSLLEALLTPDYPQRTLFVVGDIKQSIYSFQGAKPLLFFDFQNYFQQYLKQQGRDWQNIELHVSFRTTPAILKVIDHLFKKEPPWCSV